MPIHVPPNLEAAALAQIQGLTAKGLQYAQAITAKQGEIDGTSGTPPGLQAADDVNADLYDQYSVRLGYFEDEQKALNGIFPNPIVTLNDISQAAQYRSGILFPSGNHGLVPTPVPALFGTGGSVGDGETQRLTTEAAKIVILQGLSFGARPGNAAYTAWEASLNAQVTFLQSEATAIAANESYGTGSSAYTDVQAELAAVQALLPTPAYDDGTLAARAAAVTARQTQITVRLSTLETDRLPFYNSRFLILQARVNLILGTLAQLIGAQDSIATIINIAALNAQLLALYGTVT